MTVPRLSWTTTVTTTLCGCLMLRSTMSSSMTSLVTHQSKASYDQFSSFRRTETTTSLSEVCRRLELVPLWYNSLIIKGYEANTLGKIKILKGKISIPTGLREIQVNTVEEAMLLLKYGLRHRSQAATRLNYNSSRSHSVYTVKLVKVANPNKPSNALVNR